MVMKKASCCFHSVHTHIHTFRGKNDVASYFEEAGVLFSAHGLTLSVCIWSDSGLLHSLCPGRCLTTRQQHSVKPGTR